MSYKIVCDSSTDFTATERLNPVYTSVPLTVRVGEREFVDDEHLALPAMLQAASECEEAAKTACPSIDQYLQQYDCGADEVYVVTLSAELSGSYNSAFQARKIFLEEHPEKRVHVFNSRSASSGQLVIARKVLELLRAGKEYEAVVTETEQFISTMDTVFVLENLDTMAKNGRLSGLQKIVTGALKIKLVLGSTPAGAICKRGQALTTKQAMHKLVSNMEEHCKDKDISQRICVIANCCCLDRARELSELIRAKLSFREIVITATGGLSSIYASEGGVIVAF